MSEPEKILRMTTVLQRCGLSRSTIYRKMLKGTFPQRVRISDHCSGWRESLSIAGSPIRNRTGKQKSVRQHQAMRAPEGVPPRVATLLWCGVTLKHAACSRP